MNKLSIQDCAKLIRSGFPDEVKKAVSQVKILSDEGCGEATYAIASWILNESHGYKFNLDEAERLIEISISQGYKSDSYYDLSAIQRNKDDKNRFRRSFAYLLGGALSGDQESILELSKCLRSGKGCLKNELASKVVESFLSNE